MFRSRIYKRLHLSIPYVKKFFPSPIIDECVPKFNHAAHDNSLQTNQSIVRYTFIQSHS